MLLVLSLALGVSACGKSEAKKENDKQGSVKVDPNSPYANLDLSEPVTLKMYMLGDVPADMQKVMDEANNKYFKPMLNTTVDINFLSWSDYQTKYSLVLAGGEQCDLIYTSSWCYYNQESSKGAFKELNMDFINKNMPQTAKSQAPESWDQISINGKIFAVPRNSGGVEGYKYLVSREDLREKYNLPEIKDVETLEKYLFTIAEKEKGIQAIAAATNNSEFRAIMACQVNELQTVADGYDFYWKMGDKTTAPASSEIKYLYTSDQYKQFIDKMKTWAEKGVWSKNAINNSISASDAFAQGKGAATAWNGSVFTYGKQLESSGLGKAGYYDISSNIKTRRASYSADAVAITSNSKHPDRAAMALDLMKNNKDLNLLLIGGIKDVHWKLNADGTRSNGPDADKYSWDNWAWGIRRQDMPKSADEDPRRISKEADIEKRIIKTEIDGFTFDETPVKTELSVINSIRDEYTPSFDLGAFGSNTEAKYNEFKEKLNKAGLKKVQDELVKQYENYVAKKKK